MAGLISHIMDLRAGTEAESTNAGKARLLADAVEHALKAWEMLVIDVRQINSPVEKRAGVFDTYDGLTGGGIPEE